MKAYGEYVENFEAAVNHVNFLKDQQGEKGKFTTFLNEAFAKIDFGGYRMGLLELLSAPINQMNEYETRLLSLQEVTPPDHRGFSDLTSAYSLMKGKIKYCTYNK